MPAELTGLPHHALPGTVAAWQVQVDAAAWVAAAERIRQGGGRLVSLWATDRRTLDGHFVVSAAYAVDDGLAWLRLPVADEGTGYPELSALYPSANRMQRAVYDLLGLPATGSRDLRPWLRHGAWPPDHFPLRREHDGQQAFENHPAPYAFVAVEGDGVHEIPVGPVHAGTIEPGHFRFSVVGEKVLRLEERLGYKHKGIDKLFERTPAAEGHRLAGRVSGDTTVAYAWAYCMALESALGVAVPARAAWLRALLLERERVANHLGDLGAIGNDAGLAFGLAQFSRLKEQWVRLNGELFGHRFMMDRIVPGGVAVDLTASGIHQMLRQCDAFGSQVRRLQSLYEEHGGLQDRLIGAGRVSPQLAASLDLCGLAGRASSQLRDVRVDYPYPPYDQMDVRIGSHRNGDVAARVSVRFEELIESLRLILLILQQLPAGELRHALPSPRTASSGLGWVEGWRGDVLVALESDATGQLLRCHCHDPSWQNWPVLEHAVIGNIVPDFPLINKSFNLSYAGHDR